MKIKFYHLMLLTIFATTIDYRFFAHIPGIPSVTFTEILSGIMLFLFLSSIALGKRIWQENSYNSYKQNSILIWYFCWVGFASIIGVFKSFQSLRSFKDLLPTIIILFFLNVTIDTMKKIRVVLNIFIIGALINGIFGFLQTITNNFYISEVHESIFHKTDFSGNLVDHLAMGFFVHPNALAIFLIPVFILIVTIIFYKEYKDMAELTMYILFLIIISYNLFYTYSKGAFAWIIIGTLMIFIPKYLARYRFIIGISVLIAGVVSIVLFSLWSFSYQGGKFGTIWTRYQLWKTAVIVIKKSNFIKIFGNGFSEMYSLSGEFSNLEFPNSHNGLINQIIFYGFPALVLYIGLFLKALYRLSNKLLVCSEKYKYLYIFLFSSLIALFGEYFFEPANEGVVLQAQFFIIIGLSIISTCSYFNNEVEI